MKCTTVVPSPLPIVPVHMMSHMNNSTAQFLEDLRAKHDGDPEGLLHELDSLLAKAKSNELDLEAKREAAEAAYVDEIAASHLNGTTAPKMPVGLAALRDSEAAAEHLVNTLAAARQLAWGEARSVVGGRLHDEAFAVGHAYMAKVARAVAACRAAHDAYEHLTGARLNESLIYEKFARSWTRTEQADVREVLRKIKDRAGVYQWGIEADLCLQGSTLNPELDPAAKSHTASFIDKKEI